MKAEDGYRRDYPENIQDGGASAPACSGAQRCTEAMRRLREQYLEKVRELERSRKPGEGIFGMRGGPADDPCHDRYAEDLDALLKGFADEAPDSASVRAVLDELYAAPPKGETPHSAFWMLIAVQSLCPELIDRLEPGDADALVKRFASDYRRWELMPVQQKIVKALKNRVKNG